LVGKTCFQADVGDRQARKEEAAGTVHPFLDDVGVGRESDGGAEDAEEMELAQAGGVGEIAECDIFGEMLVEIVEQYLDHPSFDPFRSRRYPFRVRVTRDHLRYHGVEEGFALNGDIGKVEGLKKRKDAGGEERVFDDRGGEVRESASAGQHLGGYTLKK
jgi:hypothetical protein